MRKAAYIRPVLSNKQYRRFRSEAEPPVLSEVPLISSASIALAAAALGSHNKIGIVYLCDILVLRRDLRRKQEIRGQADKPQVKHRADDHCSQLMRSLSAKTISRSTMNTVVRIT